MNHVVVMTLTGAFGLMAMFMVDLADLFFLSLLNQTEVTAAIGYAGTIVFTNLSVSIGIGIAAAALVATNLGAGKSERAREFATSSLLFALILSAIITIGIAAGSGWLLWLLGAKGEALRLAQAFIWTLTPGYILLTGAVCCSFILRGLGDPRRAMYITLSAAVITALVDPLFIFWLRLGHPGRGCGKCPRLLRLVRHRHSRCGQGTPLHQPPAALRAEARLPGHLGDCPSGHADPAGDALRQCLHHP